MVKLTVAAPPAAIDESQNRSGGDAGGNRWSWANTEKRRTRADAVNLVLGGFVVAPEAEVDDLQWLFENTSAHIVIVTYATGGPSEMTTKIADAVIEQSARGWHVHWTKCGVVMAKKSRIFLCT